MVPVSSNPPLPLMGFAAPSGTGKTTLLRELIPSLRARGVRVAIIKHAHHDFDIDKPGKDSYELRKAGASQMLVASDRRWALITERASPQPPVLTELIGQLDPEAVDMVLVEGFKTAPIPKIELHRAELGQPFLYAEDPNVVAVASDAPAEVACDRPVLALNDTATIASFVLHYCLGEERHEDR
jgi:molybdopterin-guanine dinucleotide biosynthesis protein MobB